jgi:hypothetical protein
MCYLGQLEGEPKPDVRYTRNGLFFPVIADKADRALYSLRPARFDFRRLDAGFDRRQIFGLTTGTMLATLIGRLSPGLLAEILYNRLGLFGGSGCHSAYAQTDVRDAYVVRRDFAAGCQRDRIRAASDIARPPSRSADCAPRAGRSLYMPGIHLHHTLDTRLAGSRRTESIRPVRCGSARRLGARRHWRRTATASDAGECACLACNARPGWNALTSAQALRDRPLRTGSGIVYFGNEWFAENRTSSHMARRLAAHSRLLYVDSPGMRAPVADGRDLRVHLDQLTQALRRPRSCPVCGVRCAACPGARCGIERFRIRRLRRLGLCAGNAPCRLHRSILWFVVPHPGFLLDAVPHELAIYHCIDDYAAHPGVVMAACAPAMTC